MQSKNQRGVSVNIGQRVAKHFRRRPAAIYLATGAVNLVLAGSASAQFDNWTAGSGNWNTPGNWDSGVPTTTGTNVYIVDADAVNRTINYDYSGPAVTLGNVNVSNSGTGNNALTMTTAGLALTSSGEFIGGYFSGPNGGAGSVTQTTGSTTVRNGNLDLAETVASFGGYTLSGDGLVAVDFNETVGYNGVGAFNQSSGTHSIGRLLRLGYNVGATGTFTLSGDGSLSIVGGETIGYSGAGSFNQTGGTHTDLGTLELGENGGSQGTFTLGGSGTLATSLEIVGNNGTGLFNQSGGSNTITGPLSLGYGGGNGTFILSGDGSLTVGAFEVIGMAGVGVLTQSSGINTDSGDLNISTFGVIASKYVLSGTGTLSVGGNLIDGSNGLGIFNQSGGKTTVAGDLYVSNFTLANSTFQLTGTGTFSVGGNEFVGNIGIGTFIQAGGVNAMSGPNNTLFLGGSNTGSDGTGTYRLSGTGLLKVSGGASEIVGYQGNGLFNQTGGTNTLAGAGILTVGETAGSSAGYWLSGGILSVASNETIGDSAPGLFNQSGGSNTVGTTLNVGVNAAGTYILSGTGTLFSRIEDIGSVDGAGTFDQSGGSNGATHVVIDYGSAYNFSAGLSVPQVNEFIGSAGAGTFNQAGGTNLIPGGSFLYLGYQNTGTGTYALSGTGTLSAGIEYVGYQGVGNFNQSGGSNTLTGYPGLIVGYDSLNHSTCSYVFSAGSLNAQYETVGFDTAGVFNQTGGMNKVAPIGQNSTELDIAAFGGSVGVYNLTGGTLQASNVYVGGAGPAITAIAGGAAGGTGTLTVQNTGSMGVTGVLKVFNTGRVNLDVPVTNVGTLTLVNMGIVNLNGQLNINYGSPASDPVNTIVGYLKGGYNGGAWTGTSGIISTSAQIQGGPALSVGYADGNTDAGTAAGPNQIVVKYTLNGDANLDGFVNFGDLVAVVQNFNKAGTDWAHGNFTYGASTNFGDLVAVVQNFNKTLPPPGGMGVELGDRTIPLINPTDVQLPEPGIAAVFVMAGLLASRRRRKVQWRAYDRITHRQI